MPFTWLSSQPLFFFAWVLAILVTLTLHEYCHALAALAFGDSTAKDSNRLTLNPLAHIDPLGFMMLLIVGFGWAKPVPVNYFNLRNRRWGMALVSLAGPFSNFVAMIVAVIVSQLVAPALGPNNLLTIFLYLLALVNASLFIFNLIPIPPLDGSKVLLAIIPDKFADFKVNFETYGQFLLLGLVLADSFLNLGIFASVFDFMMKIIDIFLPLGL